MIDHVFMSVVTTLCQLRVSEVIYPKDESLEFRVVLIINWLPPNLICYLSIVVGGGVRKDGLIPFSMVLAPK